MYKNEITKLEDIEKDILFINSNSSDLKSQYKYIVESIDTLIKRNHILSKEFQYRINYDIKVHSNIYALIQQLKKYSIEYWTKTLKKEKDYNAFLKKTFSNYKYMIPHYIEDYDYRKNLNPNKNVFIPKTFEEFKKVINTEEIWNWYNFDTINYDEEKFRLFAFIDFATVTDEDRLLGIKEITESDNQNRENLKEYNKITIEKPKELKIREFFLFEDIKSDSYDNIPQNDINNSLLSVVRELKYSLINEQSFIEKKTQITDTEFINNDKKHKIIYNPNDKRLYYKNTHKFCDIGKSNIYPEIMKTLQSGKPLNNYTAKHITDLNKKIKNTFKISQNLIVNKKINDVDFEYEYDVM